MNWVLYDRELRHERVNVFCRPIIPQKEFIIFRKFSFSVVSQYSHFSSRQKFIISCFKLLLNQVPVCKERNNATTAQLRIYKRCIRIFQIEASSRYILFLDIYDAMNMQHWSLKCKSNCHIESFSKIFQRLFTCQYIDCFIHSKLLNSWLSQKFTC